ncbi:TetR/AcrR family transcriptional regulator [Streptomyces sp. HNM0663]|uniref:TetR/AcrR family transcriptional regulator n=1 Tax=Streptomyces chengmaiensis TaxID=3040919 RepID=A0ABT6HRV5_9ACTN|nr:TetR/AcrR family transcriptional regulator [Streptomyces chengmaiensis]MDH2391452.1 TetR/AcrR family transcriptional regulator [Streptomyces chengmaiensis]
MAEVDAEAGGRTAGRDTGTARAAAARRGDGRTERGRRTRLRIVDALLELVDEGVTEFPADLVAERAGVSRRLVFHHFADMPELVDAAVSRRLEQLAEQIRPLPEEGSREVRVAALAEQRARILEWITPTRLTMLRIEDPSPRVRQAAEEIFADGRRRIAEIFAEELGRLAEDPRALLLDGLDAVTTWGAWHHWRSTGKTPAQARRVMEQTVLSLLAAADREPGAARD